MFEDLNYTVLVFENDRSGLFIRKNNIIYNKVLSMTVSNLHPWQPRSLHSAHKVSDFTKPRPLPSTAQSHRSLSSTLNISLASVPPAPATPHFSSQVIIKTIVKGGSCEGSRLPYCGHGYVRTAGDFLLRVE